MNPAEKLNSIIEKVEGVIVSTQFIFDALETGKVSIIYGPMWTNVQRWIKANYTLDDTPIDYAVVLKAYRKALS